ncbi:MAG: MEDS domain-containing protein [Nocardioidaceae bacterium]
MTVAFSRPLDLGWDGHLLLLHWTEDERRYGLASWVQRGLDRGDKVIYTETAAPDSGDGLLVILGQHGVDVGSASEQGLLEILPLDEFYPPQGQITLVEAALAAGYPSVRMSAQGGAPLTWLSQQAYDEAERTLEQLCQSHPVSALCQIKQSAIADVNMAESAALHHRGIRESQVQTAQVGGTLVLAGDVDVSNTLVVSSALEAATTYASNVFTLDLTHLEFLDVTGCRSLVRGTDAFRDNGGLLEVMAPRGIRHVLHVLGFEELSQVRFLDFDS